MSIPSGQHTNVYLAAWTNTLVFYHFKKTLSHRSLCVHTQSCTLVKYSAAVSQWATYDNYYCTYLSDYSPWTMVIIFIIQPHYYTYQNDRRAQLRLTMHFLLIRNSYINTKMRTKLIVGVPALKAASYVISQRVYQEGNFWPLGILLTNFDHRVIILLM